MARFNRHVPALCVDCSKPLSVRERRVSADDDMVCTWDAYLRFREELDATGGGFWISEVETLEIETPVEHGTVTIVDPFRLYGIEPDE